MHRSTLHMYPCVTSFLFSPTVIFYICNDFKLDFHAMYCAVGLWNSFFLVMYSLFDVSRLMRWSTRSTEEIFALFISIAFCNDAFTAVRKSDYTEDFFSWQNVATVFWGSIILSMLSHDLSSEPLF